MAQHETSGMRPAFAAAIELIWQEAELLDRKDYRTWLTLWTEDGHYVVPIEPDTTDFAASLNYVYDDHVMRKLRADRMLSGFSASASDSARTVRTVSRFVEQTRGDEGGIIEIRSSQVVVACKRATTTLFAADVTHRIAFTDGQPKIVDKVIRLIDSLEALNSIGFLL
ncbi:aromatic-ring-hydroxylating dioxygenase subunit beta [Chitinasiproducens palmae]|uniref:3-phenylpropionate/cinnamic acid dioxygenase, small subunit n=1 Tax=Chitinasiproducens palmae TaxID=1770053 RepID=A0A1H2PKM1_9BURK|nr:aromatic-ring-hydroxylating dioxygenase subunit beta [Chitinasiproducens palmae]SDV46983.1 3-phenylpropionate/cinnamic acid dioxygenase, small subunit [Chitinasiproducens palmae]